MPSFSLKYGSHVFDCEVPGGEALIPCTVSDEDSPEQLVHDALNTPLGTPPLEKIVRPGERVLIVTSDITRATGSEVFLPLLVERLNRCGVHDDAIEILIALGIHRKQTEQEHRKILGPLFGRIRVTDHDCDDPQELVDLGVTASGLPLALNRRLKEVERVIVTGTAGFHYFAGFGGGRKGLVPGVASRQTCMATHFAVFNPPDVGGKHPRAVTGLLDGNPVHTALLEAARSVRCDLLLNTVLSPAKQIVGVYAGELEAAHQAACDKVNELYRVELAQPADLAVVSCGGHPKDINFIQAHKALDYGVGALRPGGTLILLAACPDGHGNATFADWFEHPDLVSFEEALRDGYEINGQTAYATRHKTENYRVILVSEFTHSQTEHLGMLKAETLDLALQMAYTELPSSPRTVVIPDGGSVLPVVRGAHDSSSKGQS